MERHYDDGTEPTILPHMRCCNGPCNQGRKPCPAPDACELEDYDDSTEIRFMVLVLCVVAVLVMAVLAFG